MYYCLKLKPLRCCNTQRRRSTLVRGQQLNKLSQSVTSNQSNSKVADKRKTRQSSYRSKFGNRPHMIFTDEDSLFIENQTATVQKFWHQCWRSDRYGSRWQVLNHTLSPRSFTRAKKILSDRGLFIFKPERSIRDGREKVSWLVLNLHGSRRNDYWLNVVSQDGLTERQDDPIERQDDPLERQPCPSDPSEIPSEQEFQNPSETLQERLSNSSKELQETLEVKNEEGDRSSGSPLDGAIAPASPSNEKKAAENKSVLPTPNQSSKKSSSELTNEDLGELNKKSTKDILSQEYKFNRSSTEASIRAVAQNLAIEAEQATEEYQSALRDASARIRAKFEAQKQKRLSDRAKRLRGY